MATADVDEYVESNTGGGAAEAEEPEPVASEAEAENEEDTDEIDIKGRVEVLGSSVGGTDSMVQTLYNIVVRTAACCSTCDGG